MYELTVEDSFAAAHKLPAHKGKCKHLHGHTFRVRVTVCGKELDEEQGFLIDFGVIKGELKKLLDTFDHQFLNDLPLFKDVPPTSEAIAKTVFEELFNQLPGLSSVTVYESERAWATYRQD